MNWLLKLWHSPRRRGYHPDQPTGCAVVSFILGSDTKSGRSSTVDGIDHWWYCNRCGNGDSSL